MKIMQICLLNEWILGRFFSEKFDFELRSDKFSEKIGFLKKKFHFRNFKFHFKSKYRFSLIFESYYDSAVPKLIF